MGSLNFLNKSEVNNSKSKNIFANVKNNYILKKIFNNLCRKKLLEIIKYNKNIQKRININFKDYKEYSETYTPIEIEIIVDKGEYDKYYNENNNFLYSIDKKKCSIFSYLF